MSSWTYEAYKQEFLAESVVLSATLKQSGGNWELCYRWAMHARRLRSTSLHRLGSGVQKWQMLHVAKENWVIKFGVDAAASFKSDLRRRFVDNKEAKRGRRDK